MRINFYGGPGSGKSTNSAWLYSELKNRNISVELVTEYVKSWAYRNEEITEYDQVYFLGKQLYSEYRFLKSGVKNIVTDSPLLLSGLYADIYYREMNLAPHLYAIADRYEKSYTSLNIFLERGNRPYHKEGRYQTKDEAVNIDNWIKNALYSRRNQLNIVYCDYHDKDNILRHVLKYINN